MRLALLTAANPRAINSGHPCLIGSGNFKLVSDGDIKSKVLVRYENVDKTVSANVALGNHIKGPAILTVLIVEANNEDSRISIYAERVE